MSDQPPSDTPEPAIPSAEAVQAAVKNAVAHHRGWFMLLGALLMLLGIAAIAFPFVTTVATKIMLGWLFLIGGALQMLHAVSTRGWSEFLLNLLTGLLFVIAGVWLAFFPIAGIVGLTVFVAVLFIVQGFFEAGMAWRMRPAGGWAWMMVSGIVAIGAGGLIINGLPGTAVWAIGLLVGINILSSGMAFLFAAMAAGKQP